jgi:hypothetical protein
MGAVTDAPLRHHLAGRNNREPGATIGKLPLCVQSRQRFRLMDIGRQKQAESAL